MRFRTLTLTSTSPIPPASTDSSNDMSVPSSPEAGPSKPSIGGFAKLKGNRRSSKSISVTSTRPTISISSAPSKRAQSYHSPSTSLSSLPATAPVDPIPSLLASPSDTNVKGGGGNGGKSNIRSGLKRRISTPRIGHVKLDEEDEGVPVIDPDPLLLSTEVVGKSKKDPGGGTSSASSASRKDAQKEMEKAQTRARSTSTSIVPPPVAFDPIKHSTTQPRPTSLSTYTSYTPPGPTYSTSSQRYIDEPDEEAVGMDKPTSILNAAYNLGESSLLRFARWTHLVKPKHRRRGHRRSSQDSEKGLTTDEDFDNGTNAESVGSTIRTSIDSTRTGGAHGGYRYWMDDPYAPSLGAGTGTGEGSGSGYFSLPSTPPHELSESESTFAAHLPGSSTNSPSRGLTLPTPALSTSLSRPQGAGGVHGVSKRYAPSAVAGGARGTVERDGWWALVYRVWSGITPSNNGGKTGEVIRELGWTVAILAGVFVVTAAVALWMIQCMPITQLKHIPSSTTDLQLLSAEIRSYMASGDIGWYHTVGVLTFVGCWKHAWSVPGAVILNILVGSLLDPIPALALLTIITATGSLFSYLLSRPLAPLIAVLFPKPLSLVRAALAPESIPTPLTTQGDHPAQSYHDQADPHEYVTPIQLSPEPSAPRIEASKGSVWRRLLIMRAMGFVPWSGMNVACGVVGVDWRVFWLTTAAGSASWSYVTASVGNILSRLAIPQPQHHDYDFIPTGAEGTVAGTGDAVAGESLTSLLRDPGLIAKLVFLSLLTLLPVVMKRRGGSSTSTSTLDSQHLDAVSGDGVHAHAGTTDGIPLQRLAPAPPLRRLDLDIDGGSVPGTPSSPLTKSLKTFTPTPAVFDLMSFGRTAARQGLNGLNGLSGVWAVGKRVVGGMRGSEAAAGQ